MILKAARRRAPSAKAASPFILIFSEIKSRRKRVAILIPIFNKPKVIMIKGVKINFKIGFNKLFSAVNIKAELNKSAGFKLTVNWGIK